MNAEQESCLEACKSGKNVLITGAAGVGKSYMLSLVVKALKESHKAVMVTASTGIAAVDIGGTTLHSAISRKKALVNIDVLVIDEVSMLDPDVLMLADTKAKAQRGNPQPIGGLQVIFVGDFCQLPPVQPDQTTPSFVFDSPVWKSLNVRMVELTQVYRQSEVEFASRLGRLRVGDMSREDIVFFKALDRPLKRGLPSPAEERSPKKIAVEPTRLFMSNAKVDSENLSQMAKLPGTATCYKSSFQPCKDQKDAFASMKVSPEIKLKVGAQVMITANLSVKDGLANGARGVVVRFSKDGWPVLRLRCGRQCAIGSRTVECNGLLTYLPIKLAWSLTIHKVFYQQMGGGVPDYFYFVVQSQGQSIDYLDVDLSNARQAGQVYTALSRATSVEGLRVRNFNPANVIVDKAVAKFYHLSEKK